MGPKLEPWMEEHNDMTSRKEYFLMSQSFKRIASTHPHSQQIHYIDCLVQFCDESKNQQGAILGGKAKPQRVYFNRDQLHLSNKGYQIWKQILEEQISDIIQDSSPH